MSYHLIGAPATRAFRIIWALEELGVDYEHTPAMPHSPEVRAANPRGKVPVLIADGTAITESVPALHYLADRHNGLTAPAGTLQRVEQDVMTHRLLDEFDSVLWAGARHKFVLPKEERIPEATAAFGKEFDRHQQRMAEEIGDDGWLADEFTINDIILGHCLRWARALKYPDAPEPLVAYLRRLKARPALVKSDMISQG